jgi:hypothetical protein
MSGMLPQNDLAKMLEWIRDGANKRAYAAEIEGIVEVNCLACHDGSNPHLSNLDGYDNVAAVVAQDTGTDLYTLVRVSHIHLFGLTFIFFILGFIFSHAFLRPLWLKSLIVLMPFAGVSIDVIGDVPDVVLPRSRPRALAPRQQQPRRHLKRGRGTLNQHHAPKIGVFLRDDPALVASAPVVTVVWLKAVLL